MNFEEFDFTNNKVDNISVDSLKYLDKFGYTDDEIKELSETIPSIFRDKLVQSYKLVCQNLTFLKELGVTNLKEIFNRYYDLFLMDYSNFTDIFKKYDAEDLIEKLEKNVEIIDFL